MKLLLAFFVSVSGLFLCVQSSEVESIPSLTDEDLLEFYQEYQSDVANLKSEIDRLKSLQFSLYNSLFAEIKMTRRDLEKLLPSSAPVAPVSPLLSPTAEKYQVGNFIADKGTWTTQTFFSQRLWNGTYDNQAASDIVRAAILDRCQNEGMNTFPLPYAFNWDNWSKLAGVPHWSDFELKPVHFTQAELDFWWHWAVEIRKHDMQFVPCIFPNDARQKYNNDDLYPKEKLAELMREFIAFTRLDYQGEPMCKYIVLKLETEDEWSYEKTSYMLDEARKVLGPKQLLGTHNQTIQGLKQIPLEKLDFIAIQPGVKRTATKEEIAQKFREAIELIPEHVAIVFAEFTWQGFERSEVGDYLLSTLPKEYPNRTFIGSWNGGSPQ